MRWFKAAIGALAMLLLMSSCIKFEGAIKIEDDGSGTVDFLTALNADALTSVLGDFDEADLGGSTEMCDGFTSDLGDPADLPQGAVITPYDEDGFCGSRVQFALSPSLDHSSEIQSLLDNESARLYKEGDNWFFESDFDADEITSEAAGAPDEVAAALFDEASFRLSVDLPGRAVDGGSNATEIGSDGRFTWDIDILNPPTRLFAQTEPGSGGGSSGGGVSPVIIGVIVAALLGAGALAWFVNKRNSDPGGHGSAAGQLASPGATPGSTSAMPIVDGAAIVATRPASSGSPEEDAAKETVLINPAEAQQLAANALADNALVDSATGAAAPATPQPVYDEALGAWIVDDPARGRLRHDPATDTWNPT
jgi:hypothetical protein